MSERLLTDAEIAVMVAAAKDAQRDEVYYSMEDEVLRLAADLQRCRAWLRRLLKQYADPLDLGGMLRLVNEVRAALEQQAAPPASP